MAKHFLQGRQGLCPSCGQTCKIVVSGFVTKSRQEYGIEIVGRNCQCGDDLAISKDDIRKREIQGF